MVLFGIGTDYILFFLFRYRERLREGEESRAAVAHAVERAGEAIASAGGAVIVSFMALVLSSLGIFKSIGPALAIAVFVTVLAALTLVPAIVALLGTKVFWPSKSWRVEPEAARFAAVGRSLGRHPVRYAVASGGILAVLALFAFGFNPNFDLGDSGAPSTVESSVALKTLQKGLPAGATDPTQVFLTSDDGTPLDKAEQATYGEELGKADGVAQVAPAVPNPKGDTALYNVVLEPEPDLGRVAGRGEGPHPVDGPRGRARGHHGLRRRHDVGLRGLPEGDEPRLHGRLPGRRARDLPDPRAGAAQPGRAAVPDGLGRPRLRRHARARRCCSSSTSRASTG